MSKATTRTNNDAAYTETKIQLRLDSLPNEPEIKVLEAFGGEGLLWTAVKRRAPGKNISVLSMDKNKYTRVQLQGENIKFLAGMDLQQFDIIDLDALGSPAPQLEILFKKQYKGVVHCTFIQTMSGKISNVVLENLGYTKTMIRKSPALFNRNGYDKFCQFLANKGVKRIKSASYGRKNYFWFFLG